jgi:hypothetical protein
MLPQVMMRRNKEGGMELFELINKKARVRRRTRRE